MKKLKKISILTVVVIAIVFGITKLMPAYAATSPNLGASSTFSILAQTLITGTGTISGNVGLNSTGAGITGLNTTMVVPGKIYATDLASPSEGVMSPSVQADAAAEFNTGIPAQATSGSIGPALDGLVVSPGVWDIGAGRLNGGVLTLDGPGVYIFRASSDFISSGSINFINGARACDLYWRVQTLATINGTSFAGTILAGTGVHFGAGITLDGRALAIGGDVTLLNTTISGPTCAVPTPTPSSSSGSGSMVVYGCKDPTATNYNYFSNSRPELCVYAEVLVIAPTPVITPTPLVVIPKLPKTGFPDQNNGPWYMILFFDILNSLNLR